ncbi:hypothetical protein BRI6_2822 [plant metagenome]|uniref:Uncharacterized protein n=1 Tax=plant metagenome TaxID=1297885 RepID=A0A484RIL6_9ZZZZ
MDLTFFPASPAPTPPDRPRIVAACFIERLHVHARPWGSLCPEFLFNCCEPTPKVQKSGLFVKTVPVRSITIESSLTWDMFHFLRHPPAPCLT